MLTRLANQLRASLGRRGVLFRHTRGLIRLQAYLDLLLILVAFLLLTKPLHLFGLDLPARDQLPLATIFSVVVFLVTYHGLSKMAGVNFSAHRTWPLSREIFDLVRCILAAQGATMVVQLLFHRPGLLSPYQLLFLGAVLLVVVGSRVVLRLSLRLLRRYGFNYRTMLIVGEGEGAAGLIRRLRGHPGYGMKLVGVVTSDPDSVRRLVDLRETDILGRPDELEEVLQSHHVNEIYVTVPAEEDPDLAQWVIRSCVDHDLAVKVTAGRPPQIPGLRATLSRFADLLFYSFTMVPRRSPQMVLKRALDLVAASVVLLIAAPVMLVTAAAIKLTSPGPVFFKQRRITCGLREFTLLKFRSMVVDAEERKAQLRAANEADGPVFKIQQDPRVTPVGRIIRKLSIDELPQLFNVLAGDMSLVGPRPLEVKELDEDFWWRKCRLFVKPGLTGLWQVSGRSTRFEDWVRYDLQYVENWSLGQDLKILLRTIPAVLNRKGAY